MRNHLKKMRSHGLRMSIGFRDLAEEWASTLSDSEGEWVAPPLQPSELSLLGLPVGGQVDDSESDEPEDTMEAAELRAAAENIQRPRAEDSRWGGRLR